jgi:hypothetical protein
MYAFISKHLLRFVLALVAVALAWPAELPNTLTAAEKREGFILLFNGKDLSGWDGDPQLWSVKDGAIVGSSDHHPVKHNTFLIYRDEFANFILQADIKLRNHNSGIQFRSQRKPDWVVTGYQADASEVGEEKSAWGNLYDEQGKGRNLMRTPDEGWLKVKSQVHHDDWNHYEIVANGHHLILRLNGVETINQEVEKTEAGVIAIQMHMGEPMEVQVRNIKLKVLR